MLRLNKFIKKSIDNQKRLFVILLAISVVSGGLAFFVQYRWGGSTVYRAELLFEAKREIHITTAGMPVQIDSWDGEGIKIVCVAELPIIIEEGENSITVKQDDEFTISLFTLDILRYNMKIYLPADEIHEINVLSAGGSISINAHGLNVLSVSVTTKNGAVSINQANTMLMLKTESGRINVDYISYFMPTVIETDSGIVELHLPDYTSVWLDYITQTGSFDSDSIRAVRDDGMVVLNVKTKSGDLIIKEKNSGEVDNYPVLQ
jgi:DUF4097 and DUF4098 domain-containing protein YvlB